MTTLENELRNITHDGLFAQSIKNATDMRQVIKEIREQAADNRLLVVSMIGETLVTLVENLDA